MIVLQMDKCYTKTTGDYMTTDLAEKNVLKKDADGHWYSLPPKLEDSFVQAVEAVMLADFMSAEWYDAHDDLNDRFGSYMRGDL
jgi:hypothetical protein